MPEWSGKDIRAAQFPLERRRGYQVAAVDRFLEEIAQFVDQLRGEVDQQHQTERSAMLLLQTAQYTADQTVAAAAEFAQQERARVRTEAEEALTAARSEAKLRMESAEAQIEHAFADASARLNDLEREIHARGRELALLESGAARFAADQAARMREQADVLLGAASAITAVGSAEVVDELVARTGLHEDLQEPCDAAAAAAVDLRTVDGVLAG